MAILTLFRASHWKSSTNDIQFILIFTAKPSQFIAALATVMKTQECTTQVDLKYKSKTTLKTIRLCDQ